MPTYDYKCEKCDFYFERNVPLAKRQEEQGCPECDAKCHRVFISAPACVVLTDAENKAKQAGLDVDKKKYVHDMREKRKKSSGSSEYNQQSNELWTSDVQGENRLNLPQIKRK